MKFQIEPRGPFSLATTHEYFGGWLPFASDPAAVAMTFPVEGWHASAAVILRQGQDKDGVSCVTGEVTLPDGEQGKVAEEMAEAAWRQALATLSLDADATGWVEVGRRDPVIGRLQESYSFLRPVLFYSAYEAAAAFIIGHRISIAQGRTIRQAMSRAVGDKILAGSQSDAAEMYAFPRPQVLRELTTFPGLNAEKVERLHGVADAALDGLLDREYLRSLPVDEALAKLQTLKGVGPFFSQGILMRGAGLEDSLVDDDVTKEAVQLAYDLAKRPSLQEVARIAEQWRPYRMWATVTLHVWLRREAGAPHHRG